MLSCVPLTETQRLYKTKYQTYIVTGSWRCVLLFISQFYFTAFGSYVSHNLRLLILIMSVFMLSGHPWLVLSLVTSCMDFNVLWSHLCQCAQNVQAEQTLLPVY